MKIIEEGHIYEVENIDGKGTQRIEFVRRIPSKNKKEGILIQELLRVIIDRINFLNEQVPCTENVTILKNLRESFILLESRAVRRKLEKETYPERLAICNECGHSICNCKEKE